MWLGFLQAVLPALPRGGSRLLLTAPRGVSRREHRSGEEGSAADAVSVSRPGQPLHRPGESGLKAPTGGVAR